MLSEVAQLVVYNGETGEFFARADGRKLSAKHVCGYVRVRIAGHDVLAHRLAIYMTTGEQPQHVDHINHDKADNRACNLRGATASENLCNREGVQANNTSGHSGVAMDRHKRKWMAYIKKDGKRVHLGVFAKIEDAIAARRAAEPVYMGAFAPMR